MTAATRANEPDLVRPRTTSRMRSLMDGVVTLLNTLFATPMRMVAIAVRLAMDPAT